MEIGHHGNNALPKEFYEMVHPEVAFMDAPENILKRKDSMSYNVKNICENLNFSIYNFETTPNIFCFQ